MRKPYPSRVNLARRAHRNERGHRCAKKAVAEAPKRFALSKALELNDGDVGQLRLLSD